MLSLCSATAILWELGLAQTYMNMTHAATTQQREELQRTIWKIAEDLRGAIGGWEFKAYVLGSLFYRFISENLTDYINDLQSKAGIQGFDYAAMSDEDAEPARRQMVEEKGFFILPSQLFVNVCKRCKDDENLNMTLSNIFKAIEGSALGTDSEEDMKGLFSDFIVDNALLGTDVKSRNRLIAKVLTTVRDMDLGKEFQENRIDAFGDAYEFLMHMYASNAGKSGGQHFTPQEVSELLARLAAVPLRKVNSVYDPACGSGSLLLKFKKTIGRDNPALKYYGQEINPTTYNLCRINMFLHNINFDNFDIQQGDTLITPKHRHLEPFDAVVSNPPYSQKWEGSSNPLLINDDRYAGPGVLAPDSTSDLAFVLHALASLNEGGTAAIVEFPGVLYRSGKEKSIRHWLVENNYIDTIIQLPANLFFGVGIATCIIVLRRGTRPDNRVLFIDASKEFVKNGNKNKLSPQNQDHIFEVFANRTEEPYFSRLVSISDILDNEANLSVSSYVEQEDTREFINIDEVNEELSNLVSEGEILWGKIDSIIKEIGEA